MKWEENTLKNLHIPSCLTHIISTMRREYKVESFIYYSKLTFDVNHILKDSTSDIQKTIEEYGRNGWKLVSTDAANFGTALYFYLYFEKER